MHSKYLLVAYFTSTSNRIFDLLSNDQMKSILSEKSIVRYNRNNKFGNRLNYFSKILYFFKIC